VIVPGESVDRIELLGVPIDVLTRDQLLRRVARLVERGERATVAYVNVHVLDRLGKHKDLLPFFQGLDLCYCDGQGVVLAARLAGDRLPERMTGADWIWDLAAQAEDRWRICWIGSEPGVTAEAAAVLQQRHPRLEIVAHHGYHPKHGPENLAFIERVNEAKADIVLVGMGTPAQERWVAANRERMDAPVVWCLGATADFISGRVSRGPRWLYDRQEWLARLVVDPKRLWQRYLLGNGRVMARALLAATRRRLRRR
jgi:N-acetylglucosaminyldiphosphoundecaprenol N-acetyl-beta-D-mannosaminyltransferase